MLILGLGEDIHELFLDGVPGASPDRLFMAPDYDALTGQGGIWRALATLPAALDAFVTLMLVAAAAYLLGLLRYSRALRPLALILGLAVLDHLPYVSAGVADLFFSCYWFLLFAGFLRLSALFPRRLSPAAVAPLVERRPNRAARLLAAVHATDWLWLHPAPVWGGAAVAGLASWQWLPASEEPVTLGHAAVSVLTIALLLWWIRVAARLTRIQYRLAEERERQRLQWFFTAVLTYLLGFGILLLAYLATSIYLAVIRPADAAARVWVDLSIATAYQLLVAVAVGLLLVAIFRRRALDPGRLIRRINVYYATAIAAVPVYAFAEDVIKLAIEGALSLSPGMATMAAISVTVPIVIGPVRDGLERLFDRVAFACAPLFESTAVLLSTDLPGHGARATSDTGRVLRTSHRLRRATRTVARPHEGRIVRLRADEVLIEFRRPEDALEAAVELWRRVAAEAPGGPRIRTAIHRGTVIPLRGGELFGEAVHGVLELRSATPVGDIRVTEAVVRALEHSVPGLMEVAPVASAGPEPAMRVYRLEPAPEPASR